MTIRKIAEIKLKAGPYGRSEAVGSGFKFYSYDKNSAAIDFYFRNQDGSPTDILNCKTELMLLIKEEGQQKKLTIIDSEVEIISALKGHARYVIPDRLRGYIGLVQGYVYLNFPDESRTDECRFDFTIERSLIEEEFEAGGDYYIKDIQVIFDEVKDTLNSKIPEMQAEYDDLVKTFTDYANEKIAEYDSRFVTLNSNFLALQTSLTAAQNKVSTLEQSITTANTNLNTRIDEINKKIDDNDVFTKAESSANVIDQIIGKESVELSTTCDFVGKISGSLVENPNKAVFGVSTGIPTTLIFGNEEPSDNYTNLSKVDGKLRSGSNSGLNIVRFSRFEYNILSHAKKLLGEQFFTDQGATDTASQVAILKTLNITGSNHVWGYGSSATGNKLTTKLYNGSTWVKEAVSTATTIDKLTQEISADEMKSFIQSDGFIHVLVYAEPSDNVTASSVALDCAMFDLKINVSANTYIESMIAQNHVENLATTEEAKAGTNTTKTMTPATTAQAIDNRAVTLASNQTVGGIKNFKDGLMLSGVSAATLTDIKEYRTSATATVPAALTSSISSIKYTLLRVGNRVKFWATVNVTTATGLDAVPEILTIPAGYKIDPTLAAAQNQIKLDVGQLLVNAVINNYAAILTSTSVFRFGTTREGNHYISGEWLTADAVPV